MNTNRFKKLLKKVREANFPVGTFAIFGSGPMAVRGLKQTKDIDIIVIKSTYNIFKNKNGWLEKDFDGKGKYYLEKDGIELWSEWGPGEWNIAKLIKTAEMIDGLPYVMLDKVLLWKEKNGRPKDLLDIKKIKVHLTPSLEK